ncbi:MAG TPA: FCD domain-containing protein [Capillimicrobium sp.]|nr:FCD domain-containing protein [Capillimicrobium sp.]
MSSSQQPAFSRLKLVPRSAQVREQLEQAIARGDYAPGDRLPSERELSEMFGVSRVSIREALRSLEAVGLVEVRHGAGTIVLDSSQRATRDLSRWMRANRGEVLELLRVRAALDELAAAEAAERQDESDLAAIRAAQDAFAEAAEAEDRGRLSDLDMAFHLAVAQASGSQLLANLLTELHGHLAESRAVFFGPEGRAKVSAAEHEAIIDAIERGDDAAAREAIRTHVASVRAVMEES